ncbi:MAG TPA: hypothetical protein VJT32_07580 [bacterium]|nr:hypothetical protein [bacterium]
MASSLWEPEANSLAADLGIVSDSNEADSSVARLLSAKVSLPEHVRVGFLELRSPSGPWSWLDRGEGMNQALSDSLSGALIRIPRIARGVVLPRLVVGERPTIDRLRQASARLQADLLLVYRPGCTLYDRQPFFGAPEYRAVCTLEMAVLDVRSGVIPVSAMVTREVLARKEHGDFSEAARIQRAEFEAVLQALGQDVTELGTYLRGGEAAAPGR